MLCSYLANAVFKSNHIAMENGPEKKQTPPEAMLFTSDGLQTLCHNPDVP